MGTDLPSPKDSQEETKTTEAISASEVITEELHPKLTDKADAEPKQNPDDNSSKSPTVTPPWALPEGKTRPHFLRRIFIDELTRPKEAVDRTLKLALKRAREHTFISALGMGVALGTAFVGYILELGLDTGIEVWLTFAAISVLVLIGLPVMLTRKWPLVLLVWVSLTGVVVYYLGSGIIGLSIALFAVLAMVYLASEDLVPLIFAVMLANTAWRSAAGFSDERAFIAGATFIGVFMLLLRFGSTLLRALATILWTIFSLSIASVAGLLVAGEAAPPRWWSKLPFGPSVLIFSFLLLCVFGVSLTRKPIVNTSE